MSVEWNGQVVLLSLTEFWIVYALTKHPGHVKNRQQLMDAANVVLDDNTITSHVKRIRRKFQSIEPAFDGRPACYFERVCERSRPPVEPRLDGW